MSSRIPGTTSEFCLFALLASAIHAAAQDLFLYYGVYIAENGTIVAQAVDPGGNVGIVILVRHGDCDTSCEVRVIESQNARNAAQKTSYPTGVSLRDNFIDAQRSIAGLRSTISIPFRPTLK